jgi:hypothetical protein
MSHVALEVPLRFLALGRGGQCNNAADTRVQALGDALDCAALARCVAAFEDHHNPLSLMADPLLEFDQFDLQTAELSLVIDMRAQAQRFGYRRRVGRRGWRFDQRRSQLGDISERWSILFGTLCHATILHLREKNTQLFIVHIVEDNVQLDILFDQSQMWS